MIDLRSDTVTRPDAGMRRAIYEAEVGDDVFGEDPTVIDLEDQVAELLGKEKALFVPSGTMGNQLAVMIHTDPGSEVLLERSCHIFNYESGASPVLSGVQLTPLDGKGGILSPDQVVNAVRPGHYWESPARLLCLENTMNKVGGTVLPIAATRSLESTARSRGLAMHLDGARLWNASVASGVPESEYAACFDTVMVCLSKGLGAPVGSLLAGTTDLITKAHRKRKMLGGGMRQIGLLAAAGQYALAHNRERLQEDHENAATLANALANVGSVRIDPENVQTNIVMFDVAENQAVAFLGRLKEEGVQMVAFGPSTIRATTHLDVSRADIHVAIDAVATVMKDNRFVARQPAVS